MVASSSCGKGRRPSPPPPTLCAPPPGSVHRLTSLCNLGIGEGDPPVGDSRILRADKQKKKMTKIAAGRRAFFGKTLLCGDRAVRLAEEVNAMIIWVLIGWLLDHLGGGAAGEAPRLIAGLA